MSQCGRIDLTSADSGHLIPLDVRPYPFAVRASCISAGVPVELQTNICGFVETGEIISVAAVKFSVADTQ
jgi:hypothetical protein